MAPRPFFCLRPNQFQPRRLRHFRAYHCMRRGVRFDFFTRVALQHVSVPFGFFVFLDLAVGKKNWGLGNLDGGFNRRYFFCGRFGRLIPQEPGLEFRR